MLGWTSVRSTAQVLGSFKATVNLSLEGKATQAHASDVRNLHAALIEGGEDASLIQRGVSKAGNKKESVRNQMKCQFPSHHQARANSLRNPNVVLTSCSCSSNLKFKMNRV